MTPPTISLLIINPNSSASMTETLKPLIQSLAYPNTTYTYLTPPTGPPSINNQADLDLSTTHTLPYLLPHLATHDAFLIACYSAHPLVAALKRRTRKPVLGIFEASVAASLLLLDSEPDAGSEIGEDDSDGRAGGKGDGGESGGAEGRGMFGIVSTGAAWEELLSRGVRDLLGGESGRFAGVATTGLSAVELHERPEEEVWGRVREAAGRLVSGGEVRVVCLGCAGMVGMEAVVREGVRGVVGEGREGREGRVRVRVVDGVKAGVGMLVALVRGGF